MIQIQNQDINVLFRQHEQTISATIHKDRKKNIHAHLLWNPLEDVCFASSLTALLKMPQTVVMSLVLFLTPMFINKIHTAQFVSTVAWQKIVM